MFSNLGKGSILHGIDRKGDFRWFMGTVEKVTPSVSKQYPNVLGQYSPLSVDIVAIVNGEQKEFKQIPGGDVIADFGQDSFIIADNKDFLYNYVKSLLKTSEDAVNEDNLKWHRKRIPMYKDVLSDMASGNTNTSEVKELKEQVDSLQSQLAEAIALLKSGMSKKE